MKNARTTESSTSAKRPTKYTKEARILALLSERSLNRFEAELYGDHCLNSTISKLRAKGHIISSEWEEVPNRFGGLTRVKRYHLIKRAKA